MDGSTRLAWLEDYRTASLTAFGGSPRARSAAQRNRLERVSFAYPGTSRVVLDDVSVLLRAGSVLHRGENGAGKTTLLKLLAKMYEPT